MTAVCFAFASHAATPAARGEYELKAAFLHKFAMFVEWPARAFATTNTPIIIGVLGQDPFGTKLETVLSSKQVHGRTLKFRRFTKVEDVLPANCHLLFIAPSEKSRLPAILDAIKTSPMLTVGDSPGYGESGVMLNLVVHEESLRFEINQQTPAGAELKISSQLLDLAIKIWGQSKPRLQ